MSVDITIKNGVKAGKSPPINWVVVTFTSSSILNLEDIDIYLDFGDPVEGAYPEESDYYGDAIFKEFFENVEAPEDPEGSGFFSVCRYVDGSFVFDSEHMQRSSAVVSNGGKKVEITLRFDIPFGFGTQNTFRARYGDKEQYFSHNIKFRDFYSPALGDSSSALETAILDMPLSDMPACKKLKSLSLSAFDNRHNVLAVRRMAIFILSRKLGFPDLVTQVSQLEGGFSTANFQQVYAPMSMSEIDAILGERAMVLASAACKEILAKKTIPKSWIEPVASAMDFIRIDVVYRVHVVAQILGICARAYMEGLI